MVSPGTSASTGTAVLAASTSRTVTATATVHPRRPSGRTQAPGHERPRRRQIGSCEWAARRQLACLTKHHIVRCRRAEKQIRLHEYAYVAQRAMSAHAAGSVPAIGCRARRKTSRGSCAGLATILLPAATREDALPGHPHPQKTGLTFPVEHLAEKLPGLPGHVLRRQDQPELKRLPPPSKSGPGQQPAASPASSADVTVVRRVLGRPVQRRSQSRPKTGRTSGTKP